MHSRCLSLFVALYALFCVAAAWAGCDTGAGSVRILSDDFPALRAIADRATGCVSDELEVKLNITSEHKQLMVPALTSNPAEFTVVTVANGSLMPLLNEGLVQPLDRYVEQYGAALLPEQLITVDGRIMAIAFMINAQHLFYRRDILAQLELEVPASWNEVLDAAQIIRDRGVLEYPLSGSFKSGWHLAQEFVNLFLGYGGQFFQENSAEPAINSAAGRQALVLMKSLTEFMPPDFLTFDVTDVQTQWESGSVAMTNLWGSRAGAVLDEEGAPPSLVAATGFAAAPGIEGQSASASTLWWVGFSLAANISEADALASFRAMLEATSTEVANEHSTLAAWLVRDARAAAETRGIIATGQLGAPPYPIQPWMTLMHRVLGQELVDYLQGRESAEKALVDIESAYKTAARESGYLLGK
ncbi:MAG: extracellular solute-binding protein [Gammaproteobacteria bacterium]|nr:extracellular solute-binding protein [Gammaproteobacteria bacterium]